MINIFKQRPYTDPATGKVKHPLTHIDNKKIRPYTDSVEDVYKNVHSIIAEIPESDRHNLHFTLANCKPRTRIFESQDVIPFDFDKIDLEADINRYHKIFFGVTGMDPEKTIVVESGHGIHYVVKPSNFKFNSIEELYEYKNKYVLICKMLDKEMAKAQLAGKLDTDVFAKGHCLRLPETMNVKSGYKPVMARLINAELIGQVFDANAILGVPVDSGDVVEKKTAEKYPKPDTEAVQKECEFLHFCKKNPNMVDEPQWFAMLSILARLENGKELCHEYSKGYDGYDKEETEAKIEHALECGPATCQRIGAIHAGCVDCKHHQQINSPITIKGENYIRTRNTGFHDIFWNADGTKVTKKVPNIEDLRKFFEQENPYVTLDSGQVFVYNGTYWEEKSNARIREFAYAHFSPKVSANKLDEFRRIVESTNVIGNDFLSNKAAGYINFSNGVLNTKTGEFGPHDKKYGFTSILDVVYDENAECPRFHQFLEEVLPDQESIETMWRYIGWVLSGDHPKKYEMALVLLGGGANGKSVLLDTIASLMGNSCTSLNMKDMQQIDKRMGLNASLLNINYETSAKAFKDPDFFKTLVSGERIQAKVLYKDVVEIIPRAKHILSCNTLPKIDDSTHGFNRRLIIMEFGRRFTGRNADPMLSDKLKKELAGIAKYAIAAYMRLEEDGYFKVPEQSKKMVREYLAESSDEHGFVSECTEQAGDKDFVSIEDLYKSYQNWSIDNGCKALSRIAFSKKISGYLPTLGCTKVNKKIAGKLHRGYYGRKLLEYESNEEF